MTFQRYAIVRHKDFPSLLFRVVAGESHEKMAVRPYKLSDLDGNNISVPVEGWEQVAAHYSELPNVFPEVAFNDWTYDTLGAAAQNGFPVSLRHNGDTRYDIVSYAHSQFTLVGQTDTVSSYNATDYRIGSSADWSAWTAYKAEIFAGLVAGYVVKINDGMAPNYEGKDWQYVLLRYDYSDYPEQHCYMIDPDTMEQSRYEFYCHAGSVEPTGMTLEQLQDALSGPCAVGNVVMTRSGDYAVVTETDSKLCVSVLDSELALGEPMELRRWNVESVVSAELDDTFKALYHVRLEQAKQLQNLSINTVNRALAHADSNGYCSETLVALTSAGHKVPKVRITGTIVIPIDVEIDAQQDWETVRGIFGRKLNHGEDWKTAALSKVRLDRHLNFTQVAKDSTDLVVEPVYGKPVVRPL